MTDIRSRTIQLVNLATSILLAGGNAYSRWVEHFLDIQFEDPDFVAWARFIQSKVGGTTQEGAVFAAPAGEDFYRDFFNKLSQLILEPSGCASSSQSSPEAKAAEECIKVMKFTEALRACTRGSDATAFPPETATWRRIWDFTQSVNDTEGEDWLRVAEARKRASVSTFTAAEFRLATNIMSCAKALHEADTAK